MGSMARGGVNIEFLSFHRLPPFYFFFSPPLHFSLSFVHLALLENGKETSAKLAKTRQLLAAETKSSFVSRSGIWNSKNNVC